MASNPKDSKWRSTPRSVRRKKGREVFCEPSTWEALDAVMGPGLRSAWIEATIREALGLPPVTPAGGANG